MLPCTDHCLLQSGGRLRVALRRCGRADLLSKRHTAPKRAGDAFDRLCALLLGAAPVYGSRAGLLARVWHRLHWQRLENSGNKHRNFRNHRFQGSYSCLIGAVSAWSPQSFRASHVQDVSEGCGQDTIEGNHQHIQIRSPSSTRSNSSITSALSISTQPPLKGWPIRSSWLLP